MEAFTFALSTQVDFPIYVRMYVSSHRSPARHPLTKQWFSGRKAETNPFLGALETTRSAAHWLRAGPDIGFVCDSAAMVRLQALGGACADRLQDL